MAKAIIVTGGSRGIGKAVLQFFAQQNFHLAFCSLHEKNVTELSNSLKAEFPHLHIFGMQADMSKRESVKDFAAACLEKFPEINILVNNAGTYLPGQVHQEPDGTLELLIETNLYSAYYMSKSILPAMIKQQQGHVFNICSIAGMQAYPNGGSYSISKFAMQGLSRALREELKEKHVRVTTLYPGAVYTDSWAGSGLPESRFIESNDIAKLIFDIYQLSSGAVVEDIVIRPQLGDI